MHALARDGVEIAGERGDKRLALAGLHLGNGPLVQGDAADNLNIEVAQARDATRGLPHRGKCLREQVIKRLASLIALAEELCLASELLIRHGFELGLKVVNHLGDFLVFLELFIRANREQLGKEVGHMGSPSNLKRIHADNPSFSLYSLAQRLFSHPRPYRKRTMAYPALTMRQ